MSNVNMSHEKLIKTIFKWLKREVDQIEYVFLLDTHIEHYIQMRLALEFYEDYTPIVWKVGGDNPLVGKDKIKIADITTEHPLFETKNRQRCDLVVSNCPFIDRITGGYPVANEDTELLILEAYKSSSWHYVELKQGEINASTKKWDFEHLLDDLKKVQVHVKKPHSGYSPSSINSIGIYRVYGVENISDVKKNVIASIDKKFKVKTKILNLEGDESTAYLCVVIYELFD